MDIAEILFALNGMSTLARQVLFASVGHLKLATTARQTAVLALLLHQIHHLHHHLHHVLEMLAHNATAAHADAEEQSNAMADAQEAIQHLAIMDKLAAHAEAQSLALALAQFQLQEISTSNAAHAEKEE
jgi:hypothetical protein